MKSYLRLIKTVLLHKWYVFVAGRRLKVPFWRLVVHDLSKFSPTEFGDYARWFYDDKQNFHGFNRAWLHHQHRNDHHWESWVQPKGNQKYRGRLYDNEPVLFRDPEDLRPDEVDLTPANTFPLTVPTVSVLPMPMACVREMVADWFAAGKAYNGAWPKPTDYIWYNTNRHRMHLHPDTEMRVGLVLAEAAQYRW